jgi:hypothetical protein
MKAKGKLGGRHKVLRVVMSAEMAEVSGKRGG